MSCEHSILGSGEPVCDCWLCHNVALYTGIFFFLTKHIFVFTSSRDLALEKRCVVKVTHYTGLCFDKGIPKDRAAAARGDDFIVSELLPS